jgi:hypothetical protein
MKYHNEIIQRIRMKYNEIAQVFIWNIPMKYPSNKNEMASGQSEWNISLPLTYEMSYEMTISHWWPRHCTRRLASVCRSSPRNRKKSRNWTEPDRLGPDWLRLHTFGMIEPIWTELVYTNCVTTGCLHNTPLKYAHFEPIFKRNSSEMHELWPKWYVTSKSNFVQHLIVAFFEM